MELMQSSTLLVGDNTIPGVKLPKEIVAKIPEILQACRDFGLDFYETVVEFLRYDEISEIAAYDGFPVRYPHWKFGEQYEDLSKGYQHGYHRIFEMVVNTNPCYIYCLDSNTFVDHVTVIAHATGHNDFFKNNIFFSQTSQNMLNELANHGSRIRRIMSEWGKDNVGRFIDKCLSVETLIDCAAARVKRQIKDPTVRKKREYHHPRRLNVPHDYMEEWINTPEWKQQEWQRIRDEEIRKELAIFEDPTKDVFGFIKDHAPLNQWQHDVIAMLYDEAMYFAPQRLTKTANEGWACLKKGSLVLTENGFLPIEEIVEGRFSGNVCDGQSRKSVTDWFKLVDRETMKVKTRRGFVIDGSVTHRVLTEDGWKRLDELKKDDRVKLPRGTNLWTDALYELDWFAKRRTKTLDYVASEAGVSRSSVEYHRYQAKNPSKELQPFFEEVDAEIKEMGAMRNSRKDIKVPSVVDEKFAAFMGYMIGDGNISDVNRSIGFTTGNKESRDNFQLLLKELFGLEAKVKWDDTSKNGRWRVIIYSRDLRDLLVHLGFPTGPSARMKTIPNCVLRSPKSVMSAFLSTYFDCDGCAHGAGITLSTSSTDMTEKVQMVLLNYGILSRKHLAEDECWQVVITGKSAEIFEKEINFGLTYKRERLCSYVHDRHWFVKEDESDEIVSVENTGKHTVYDFTVKDTHQYVACGLINHNSFSDSQIMARFGLAEGSGIFDYAAHKASVLGGKLSMNPYKLGYLLFLWIEECWNKGKFGREYDQCTDARERELWDKKLGLGHEKVFEVRQFYDDVLMISEFFDQEFADKYEFFVWEKFPNGEYKIVDRDAKRIKHLLLRSKLNGGLPEIKLVDDNHKGRRILLMEHAWDGRILHPQMTKDTLKSLSYLWKAPTAVLSKDKDGREIMYYCEDDKVEVTTPGKV